MTSPLLCLYRCHNAWKHIICRFILTIAAPRHFAPKTFRPPRRFAPIFKTFRPRRRDDLSQFKTFRPPVRRFAPTEDVSPPMWDVSPPIETFCPLLRRFAPYWDVSPPREDVSPHGKDVSPLSKLRHFEPLCERFPPHYYRTFRPHSYRTFRTLGKSFRPRSHRTFRTLEKTFRPRSYRTFRTPEKTFRPLPKLRYLSPIYISKNKLSAFKFIYVNVIQLTILHTIIYAPNLGRRSDR